MYAIMQNIQSLLLCLICFAQAPTTTLSFSTNIIHQHALVPSAQTFPRPRSGSIVLRQPATNSAAAAAVVNSKSSSFSHNESYSSTRLYSAILPTASTAISAMATIVPTIDIARTTLGILLARKISTSGYKKRSLSQSGAISAFVVASLALSTSFRNGITLLSFYWTSSKLTRVGSAIKGKLEEGHSDGGERGMSQVLACSAIAVICAVVRKFWLGMSDGPLAFGASLSASALASSLSSSSSSMALLGDQLTLAYVAFFACCAGDTWASELGVLSKSHPRLIIKPWKIVPPGTNGGVSAVGLGASAAGGILMGLIHGIFVPGGIASLLVGTSSSSSSEVLFGREIALLSLVGFIGGFGGSLLDSFLGATVQATHYDNETNKIAKRSGPTTKHVGGWSFLSNEMVNVVSTALSALIAALVAKPLLGLI